MTDSKIKHWLEKVEFRDLNFIFEACCVLGILMAESVYATKTCG